MKRKSHSSRASCNQLYRLYLQIFRANKSCCHEFSLPWFRRETLIASKWFKASLTRLLGSWKVFARCCWSSTYSSWLHHVGFPGGVCRESEWVCKGLHMLRSCMSIRSRLLGGNFMVFSVFFIVFTVAFARCLHDKGWLLKPCSCSANQIFSRDPAEKLAGFSTWDLLETEIKLRVLLEQHNYIFFGAMLSFDELFECLVLLIACRMSGNFSWQTAVLHWPFLRPMIAWAWVDNSGRPWICWDDESIY